MLGADEPRLSRNVLERRQRRPRATALSARATVNPWVTHSSEPSAQAPGLRESPRQGETQSGKPGCFRRVEAKLLTLRQTYPPPPSCLGSACTLGGGGGGETPMPRSPSQAGVGASVPQLCFSCYRSEHPQIQTTLAMCSRSRPWARASSANSILSRPSSAIRPWTSSIHASG